MKSGGILTFYSGLRGISPFFFYYYMSFCVCLSVSIIAPTMILDSIEKFWLTVSSIFPFVQFWADFRNSTEITLYSLCIWTFLGLFFYLFSVNAFFWSVCLSELNRTHNDIRLWVKLWKKNNIQLKFYCILLSFRSSLEIRLYSHFLFRFQKNFTVFFSYNFFCDASVYLWAQCLP